MYSIVMVVAMAGAPEAPSFCCKGGKAYGNDCYSKKDFCCKKDYSCAKNDCAPVHVAPPCETAKPVCCDKGYSNDCDNGYKSKGCCFFDKFKSKCGKGNSNGYSKCDKGYSKCDKGSSNNCDTGYKSKGCCFFGKCCDKGNDYGYATQSDCGTVVVPSTTAPVAPVTPKKEMPKTGPSPKVGA